MKLNLFTLVFKQRRPDGSYEFAKSDIITKPGKVIFTPVGVPELTSNGKFTDPKEWEELSVKPTGLDELELKKCTLEIE